MATDTKYPRTFHLPWSPGASSDDKKMASTAGLDGQDLVVTTKMDGENTTLTSKGWHARSLDSGRHPSRSWVAALQGRVGPLIPRGWRVCGENLFAQHSIHYDDLPDYFLVFGIWDEANYCLSWDDTELWCQLFVLTPVPVRARLCAAEWEQWKATQKGVEEPGVEGYVVRTRWGFHASEFSTRVGKWVRPGHVQTSDHWMNQPMIQNQLAKK